MKYLFLFKSEEEHTSAKESIGEVTPRVSFVMENNNVYYTPNILENDYSLQYFTIEALEDGLTARLSVDACEYHVNDGDWTTLAAGTDTIAINTGQTLSFRGNLIPTSSNGIGTFTISKKCNVKGNIMSLLYGDNFEDQTDLTGKDYSFFKLFYNCTNIIDSSKLILPATTLASNCYSRMFEGCTGLTTVPELPATTLAYSCYYSMFYGCTGLTTVPELPATTLAEYCYNYMFYNCTSLTTAPELPATTLTPYCYSRMFYGCTNLTTAPELPATTLTTSCYYSMFQGCTSLTQAPELPAITLTTSCYYFMFQDCTSLTTAPSILPATTLASTCYYGMFSGCTDLTTAPELPATTLSNNCYSYMFYGCSKLNYIKALFTTTPSNIYTNNWVYQVSSTGTFVKNKNATWNVTGVNGIPTGWTVINDGEENNDNDYHSEYFTIEALKDGLKAKLSVDECEYRVDDGDWTTLYEGTYTIAINTGQTLSFRGKLIPNSISGIGKFTVSKQYNVSGNIMSLLYGDDFEGKEDLTGKNYAFYNLFSSSTTLISAENLILPATTLAKSCYNNMFAGCTNLTTAPELPSTTLAERCYNCMFQGCSKLTTAPELPATTLADSCYRIMFENCKALTTAPELPATTLASSCYYSMFYGCTSLKTAPVLPATTLADSCYDYMFRGCTSLTTAPELPATTLADNCYNSMFYSCTNLTTAPKLPATTLADWCYYYMFYGCTNLTTAPELPATGLAVNCYGYMFWKCTSLNNITMLATDISATNCLSNWVSEVASTGTFVKSPSMTSLPRGVNGIPNGWTVVNISPCIINQASESITFVYSDGLFTPTNEIIDLSQYFTNEELLSVQPECEITVTLQDKTDNVLTSDYVWTNDKTLSDVLNELDVTTDVYDINVIITEVNAPEDNGYYYYYMLDETEPFVEKD